MAERDEAGALRLVVVFLRYYAKMTQAAFGKASRVDQSDLSKYERGTRTPPEELLRRMAEAADVEWPVVVHLRRAFGTILSTAAPPGAAPEAQPLSPALLEPVLLAVTPYLLSDRTRRRPPEEELREAEEIWTALERYPVPRRRRLIEQAPRASRSPALAARVCAASARAASEDAPESLELAELALSIAERVPDEEGLRSRARGAARVAKRISEEDRLRICDAVQSATGAVSLAEVVCALAGTLGVERALQYFKLALADFTLRHQEPRDGSTVH